MKWALGIYLLIDAGIIIIAIFSWLIWDKRYRKNQGTSIPQGYVATDEVFIDPVDGKKYKVYYEPTTGDRFYQEVNYLPEGLRGEK
ncbi:hypothetical protein REC12_13645 [Desulfosporosinus sp. PR]|uniref:hypothetical protein n=1 Tax=Candidatus Desulfosporosinus nitrosoreducens TaxID=3401928 RepID=UPI0027FE2C6D|nr:hypothetical protein [Desulfosporosinus sp. PR]MDQ7094635.1 hypothetical protein [Desulfosporosinus sp. PR]